MGGFLIVSGVSISVPAHTNEDLKPGMLNSLKKQAGLE
ncbi:MAG: type II toxin-antitoxin system HicA family toxin [Treponema sp.]|nr:type II toxin-antitoxin system HicA family toxin [Treponema sp.]